MKRILRILFVFAPIATMSCSFSGSASRDDRGLTATSPEGLADFFTRECLGQAGATRARAEFRRARDACLGDSQCLNRLPDEIAWTVAAPGKEKLEVVYDWRGLESRDPPASGRLGCSLAFSDDLQANMRTAITRLRVDGRGFSKTENKYAFDLLDSIESWDSGPSSPSQLVLTLQHYPSPDKPDAGPVPAKDSFEYSRYVNDIENIRAELRRHAERPWRLKAGVEANQP
jgi:hypothetical protein